MVNHPNRSRGPLTLRAVPLTVLNRALDLFGEPAAPTASRAMTALLSAESRISVAGSYTPLAQAIAEYMSLTGPWAEDGGEHAGQSGYQIEP